MAAHEFKIDSTSTCKFAHLPIIEEVPPFRSDCMGLIFIYSYRNITLLSWVVNEYAPAYRAY